MKQVVLLALWLWFILDSIRLGVLPDEQRSYSFLPPCFSSFSTAFPPFL